MDSTKKLKEGPAPHVFLKEDYAVIVMASSQIAMGEHDEGSEKIKEVSIKILEALKDIDSPTGITALAFVLSEIFGNCVKVINVPSTPPQMN